MGIQWDTAEILQSHTAETLANCLTPSQNGLNTLNNELFCYKRQVIKVQSNRLIHRLVHSDMDNIKKKKYKTTCDTYYQQPIYN